MYKNYPKNVSEITNAKFEVGTLSDDFINPKQKKINRSDCDIHPRATNECNPRRWLNNKRFSTIIGLFSVLYILNDICDYNFPFTALVT